MADMSDLEERFAQRAGLPVEVVHTLIEAGWTVHIYDDGTELLMFSQKRDILPYLTVEPVEVIGADALRWNRHEQGTVVFEPGSIVVAGMDADPRAIANEIFKLVREQS